MPREQKYRHISSEPIDPCRLLEQVRNPKSGALVLFSGETRNHHEGVTVDYLDYEAQEEMAERMIAEILSRAVEQYSLHDAAAIHRIGRVDISEPAVVVAASASHRQEAFEAARFIIDEIKANAPIWKREHSGDGKARWQND